MYKDKFMKDLISKYISNEATEEELLELEQWVNSSDENRKEFANTVNSIALATSSLDENNIKPVTSTRNNRITLFAPYVAASIAAIIMFCGAYFYADHKIESYKKDANYIVEQNDVYLDYYTPYGVKGMITLPDSSKVWLNSGSRISFPSKFTGSTRDVSFAGEGYFSVTSDSTRPMIITTANDIDVRVLGTEFNLSAYEDDKTLSLMLIKGKVELDRKGKALAQLEPSKNFIVDLHDSSNIDHHYAMSTEIDRVVGWKEGWLIFDDTPLSEVFKKMKRWYGIEIKVEDSRIYDQLFTAKFKNESASQIFDLMQKTTLLKYELKDSVAIIRNYDDVR